MRPEMNQSAILSVMCRTCSQVRESLVELSQVERDRGCTSDDCGCGYGGYVEVMVTIRCQSCNSVVFRTERRLD